MTDNHQKNNEEEGNAIQAVLSSSKDVKCPICLATIKNKALTDPCLHEFCFDCISEWSTNHSRCPICRQTYSNIRYNFVSNETFDLLPVQQQLELDDEEIEDIQNRMVLYLQAIALRNRTQRERDQLSLEINQNEDEVYEMNFKRNKRKKLKKKLKEMRSQLRELDDELNRLNVILSADNPTEEELSQAFNGREEEIRDLEVSDLLSDGQQMSLRWRSDGLQIDFSDVDNLSVDSLTSSISDDSGYISDYEESSEDEESSIDEEVHHNNTRKRRPENNENSDSDEWEEHSSKRKRNKRH